MNYLRPQMPDFSFAGYHSRTELKGNVIGYTRTFELKELSVPVSKADELKKFYRIIASDEPIPLFSGRRNKIHFIDAAITYQPVKS